MSFFAQGNSSNEDKTSASVTVAELFPFLTKIKTKPGNPLTSEEKNITSQVSNSGPLTEVHFRPLVVQTLHNKILYRQVCAQPEYERFHPYQLRAQLGYKDVHEKTKQRVDALLAQKREAEFKREKEYRAMVFGTTLS